MSDTTREVEYECGCKMAGGCVETYCPQHGEPQKASGTWHEEADRACAAATPGPWAAERPRVRWRIKHGEDFIVEDVRLPHDARFIAQARAALPRALAELRAADARIAELQRELVEYSDADPLIRKMQLRLQDAAIKAEQQDARIAALESELAALRGQG